MLDIPCFFFHIYFGSGAAAQCEVTHRTSVTSSSHDVNRGNVVVKVTADWLPEMGDGQMGYLLFLVAIVRKIHWGRLGRHPPASARILLSKTRMNNSTCQNDRKLIQLGVILSLNVLPVTGRSKRSSWREIQQMLDIPFFW